MLRGENIVCGTSTTSTGTLTLAATPGPPGGIDFDVLARATGVGFANSAAVLVSYTIIEYTGSTFATAKSMEKGIGTLTLGGSSGIANCTLARTTPQVTATNLNSPPATYNTNAPTAVSIGTAANTLVFIGPAACDLLAYPPYFETGGDNLGVPGVVYVANASSANLVSGTDYYVPFTWEVPMLVKRASVRLDTAYSGGSPVSNAYARLYALGTNGRPGKLLIDLGLIGSANTSLNTGTNISTAAHANGFFLNPGKYFFNIIAILSGGVTAPKLKTPSADVRIHPFMGTTAMTSQNSASATGGNGATPADPANVTAYAAVNGITLMFSFTLAPS